MLEAHEIGFAVNGAPILRDLSVAVRPGEVLALLGPNGAGKSTLLALLSGELTPSHGEVQLDGRRLGEFGDRHLARRRAVLRQASVLDFAFTVREVVLMGRTPHLRGTETPRDLEIARLALERLDMAWAESRIYPTLSGGEKQRVQLARTLAQIWGSSREKEATGGPGRYLLLDEPVSALDLAHQHRVMRLCRELAGEKVGVAIVVHDLNLALRYADRAVLLEQGRLHASGAACAVLQPQALREVFRIRAERECTADGLPWLDIQGAE